MLIYKTMVEGREVVISTILRPEVGKYCVYQDKIYNITGSQGFGMHYAICLEKKSTNERFWVKGKEIKNIKMLSNPTGYMEI